METWKKEGDSKGVYYIAAVVAVAVAGSAYFGYRHRTQTRQNVEAHIRTWFESPRLLTELLMERYGPPSDLTPGVATWYEQGSWKRISVHGDSPDNYLEQVIGYQAPSTAVAPLAKFDHGVRIDLAREELSATSNQESLNYLALNMAHEVASGKRSAKDARHFYERTAKLAASGKSSPYLEKLLFKPYRRMPEKDWRREIGY